MLAQERSDRWFIIINPISGGGKGGQAWPRIKASLEKAHVAFDHQLSEYSGHIEEITTSKIREGFHKFLIVGGDGTLHGFINGACNQSIRTTDQLTFAMISVGTGNDWVRSEGIPKSISDVIKSIKAGSTKTHDIGAIYHDGSITYFINVVGLGFDAYVLTTYYKMRGWHIGKLKYIYALVVSLFKFNMQKLNLTIDGEQVFHDYFYNMNVGIGKYCGGGMKMVPKANPADGKLDLTFIKPVPKWKVVLNIPRLFSGKFIKIDEAFEHRNSEILIHGSELLIEADGEELAPANHIRIKSKSTQIRTISL